MKGKTLLPMGCESVVAEISWLAGRLASGQHAGGGLPGGRQAGAMGGRHVAGRFARLSSSAKTSGPPGRRPGGKMSGRPGGRLGGRVSGQQGAEVFRAEGRWPLMEAFCQKCQPS